MRMTPNQGLEGSAEQRRCSVPSSLRATAPPQPHKDFPGIASGLEFQLIVRRDWL